MKALSKSGFAYNALFMFATTVAFVLPLALLNQLTKPLADQYWANARQSAVLLSLGIAVDPGQPQAVRAAYESLAFFSGDTPQTLRRLDAAAVEAAEAAGKAPSPLFYLARVDGQRRIAGSFSGLGLWSSISLAIGFDEGLATISGLRVLFHGETPGLGGRIAEPWFMNQFTQKRLADTSPLLRFKTTGGPPAAEEAVVDGIAGATITTNGVRDIIESAVARLRPLAPAIVALGGQP